MMHQYYCAMSLQSVYHLEIQPRVLVTVSTDGQHDSMELHVCCVYAARKYLWPQSEKGAGIWVWWK